MQNERQSGGPRADTSHTPDAALTVIDTSALLAILLDEPERLALAVVRGEPLLFKGQDFSQTDVVPFAPRPLT